MQLASKGQFRPNWVQRFIWTGVDLGGCGADRRLCWERSDLLQSDRSKCSTVSLKYFWNCVLSNQSSWTKLWYSSNFALSWFIFLYPALTSVFGLQSVLQNNQKRTKKLLWFIHLSMGVWTLQFYCDDGMHHIHSFSKQSLMLTLI